MREVQTLLQMEHPNIVRGIDYYMKDEIFGVVMERADMDLCTFLRNGGTMSFNNKLTSIAGLISAISFLHNNNKLVHCDLKPDNILLINKTLKLADISLLKSVNFYKLGWNDGDPNVVNCQTTKYKYPYLSMRDDFVDIFDIAADNRDFLSFHNSSGGSRFPEKSTYINKWLKDTSYPHTVSNMATMLMDSDIYSIGIIILTIIFGTEKWDSLFLPKGANYNPHNSFTYFVTNVAFNPPEVIADLLRSHKSLDSNFNRFEDALGRMLTMEHNKRCRNIPESFKKCQIPWN